MTTENKTRVVNLYKEPYDVYIGRAGKGQSGYFGNPIRTNENCQVCGKIHLTGRETLPCFKRYFRERLRTDKEFKMNILGLRGMRLGCFCAPKPCHGDVLVEYLEWVEKNSK